MVQPLSKPDFLTAKHTLCHVSAIPLLVIYLRNVNATAMERLVQEHSWTLSL